MNQRTAKKVRKDVNHAAKVELMSFLVAIRRLRLRDRLKIAYLIVKGAKKQ